MATNRGAPTPPIAFPGGAAAATARFTAPQVEVDDALAPGSQDTGADVTRADETINEASRDWWPLAMIWALDDQVAAARERRGPPERGRTGRRDPPGMQRCAVPVTAAAGRSGVCGASVPVFGGVLLDLTHLAGIVDVDTTSMLVDVLPGTFGDVFEDQLRAEHGLTCGHWPQSMALSTVGGWVACRGAGQLSTRYGKIEDIVARSRRRPRRRHARSPREARRAPPSVRISISSSSAPRARSASSSGRACASTRARPPRAAPLTRSTRSPTRSTRCGASCSAAPHRRCCGSTTPSRPTARITPATPTCCSSSTRATRTSSMRRCASSPRSAQPPQPIDVALVEQWLEHRNDVSALESLVQRGFVVDTMEISGSWRALPEIYDRTTEAMRAVEHTLVASAHQSHSYTDGGCLYFTFAGRPPEDQREQYYRAMWDAGQRAVLATRAAR